MWGFKYILIIAIVTTITGCAPRNIPFSTNNFKQSRFYNVLPQILERNIKLDSVILYETTFEEKPYEGYFVVDYSEVNAQNDKNILHYKDFKGFYQKLYILKFITEPKDSIAIYFSLKYNAFDQCVGFGPSYLGYIDEHKKSLYFYTELYTRSRKNIFALKKSRRLRLYMNSNQWVPGAYINIEKMIVERSYEIGNNVVIDIPRIFRDTAALKFVYLGAQKME
jgi:hypothetical protein